jgi:hypothetical protein
MLVAQGTRLGPYEIRDAEKERRFLLEARAASALNHPNIVTPHDIVTEGDIDFLVPVYLRPE